MNHLPFNRLLANFNSLATKPASSIFDHRKGLGEEVIQALPISVSLHEIGRFLTQLLVTERLQFLFDLVDVFDYGHTLLNELSVLPTLEGLHDRFYGGKETHRFILMGIELAGNGFAEIGNSALKTLSQLNFGFPIQNLFRQ